MTALLGMVAWAGYQNRDKLMDAYRNFTKDRQVAGSGEKSPAEAGDPLTSGLNEVIDRLMRGGQSETAESWVESGPNKPIDQSSLEQAVGQDTIDQIAQEIGLTRSEVLDRLTADLPRAVDGLTPGGRLPTA